MQAEPLTQEVILEVETRIPQQRRVWESRAPFLLYLGGIGAGKTFTGAVWALSRPPGTHGLIVAPTHKNLLSGALATLLPMAYGSEDVESGGVHSLVEDYNKQEGALRLVDGKVIFIRSLDRPELIRGANVDWLWGDELGIIKWRDTWDILIGRVRRSNDGRHLVTTTPPTTGINHWLHDVFIKNGRVNEHETVTVKTSENVYLPQTFESRLRREYADAYAARELDAEWIDVGEVEVYDADQILAAPFPPSDLVTARAWDTAATGGGGDYTAGALLSRDAAGKLYIRDFVRGQWEPSERDAIMLRTAEADGVDVRVCVARERGAAGVSQADTWLRMFAGFIVSAELESGDKVVRAGPMAAQINGGNVVITSEPGRWQNYWHQGRRLSGEAAQYQLRQNLKRFPQGRTKDESDALALALQAVVKRDSGIYVSGV